MKQGRAMTTGSTSKPAKIGLRVSTEVLREKRAGYGERIIHALSGELTAEFGRGFTKTSTD
jgi:hypothetical protein